MTESRVAILNSGLVTSVGLSAPVSCAAIRAKVANPTETRFRAADGGWIMGHAVTMEQPWRGRTKLVKMAAMAVRECLAGMPRETWSRIPLMLCVAERNRPGRIEGVDDQLFPELERELDGRFLPQSAVVAQGRAGAGLALARARDMIAHGRAAYVLIVGVDSYLTWPTLSHYLHGDRLLTARNSNGFMPGEAAGAVLVGRRPGDRPDIVCAGNGTATEVAHIDTEEPLRGEGMTRAIKQALAEAGCEMHDIDYRMADVSGEQYYFKEAALALNRILRRRKVDFELWHPAECIGEVGAASGPVCLAVAQMAARKAYAPGPAALLHFSNDDGLRLAVVTSAN
jgi:3-oxoacyl-[acyl-carrier-protein] synthase-1